eukprot:jgi/Mesvir1/18183/Mv09470-RA.1
MALPPRHDGPQGPAANGHSNGTAQRLHPQRVQAPHGHADEQSAMQRLPNSNGSVNHAAADGHVAVLPPCCWGEALFCTCVRFIFCQNVPWGSSWSWERDPLDDDWTPPPRRDDMSMDERYPWPPFANPCIAEGDEREAPAPPGNGAAVSQAQSRGQGWTSGTEEC